MANTGEIWLAPRDDAVVLLLAFAADRPTRAVGRPFREDVRLMHSREAYVTRARGDEQRLRMMRRPSAT